MAAMQISQIQQAAPAETERTIEEEAPMPTSARKASTSIEEFTVSELIAQLQKQGKRVKLVD